MQISSLQNKVKHALVLTFGWRGRVVIFEQHSQFIESSLPQGLIKEQKSNNCIYQLTEKIRP